MGVDVCAINFLKRLKSILRTVSLNMGKILASFLPPKEYLPEIIRFSELKYPRKTNLAAHLIDENIDRGRGKKDAVRYQDYRLSYLELREASSRLANGLIGLGVEEHDRVIVRTANTPEFIISHLAIQRMGAITTPVNPLFRMQEIVHIANSTEAQALVVQVDLLSEVEKAAVGLKTIRKIIVIGGKPPDGEAFVEYGELIRRGNKNLDPIEMDIDDVCLILHTSGTTGRPKGVVHTLSGILSVCYSNSKYCLQVQEYDVIGGHPSLAFAFGFSSIGNIPLQFGATASLLSKFTPEQMLETVEKHKITILISVPTACRRILDVLKKTPHKYDLSSLRIIQTGGEPLTAPLYHELKRLLPHVEIVEHIGCTESIHGFVSNRLGKVKPGSFGVEVPGFEVKVFSEDGNESPIGVPGELGFKGPIGFLYWRDSELQRRNVRGGWNFTGDIVYKDEDGYFWYLSRTDDMIKSAAYLISPHEVESVLMKHATVLEAGVIGVPDEERGQRVKAFIVLREGCRPSLNLEEEIKRFVKSQIAPYKAPAEIDFTLSLPKSATDKILRKNLRQR